MLDASYIKVHHPCSGSGRRQSRHGTNKRGLNTKLHMAVDASGMPVRIQVTSGTVSDCKEADKLIERISGNYLLADRGYDTKKVIEEANSLQFKVVIPPKRNRKNSSL